MEEKKERRLVAIMFTDIVGYTALMQENEAKAKLVRDRHRQVFNQFHRLHNGKIVQYFGDGTLSVFKSGVEAVECAIAIQRELKKGPKVPLRIGLHIGDIVFDGTEIYGDGVNLASRIESMSVEGAILLSGRLNEELKNHPQILTQSLGRFELKNIVQPVEVFAVGNEAIKVPERSKLKGKQKPVNKSIAVLPFVNMSRDEENEYFSDGLTEEIINALAKIEGLKVTSRTSSFYFKNKNVPIAEIGKTLDVSTILEGSVRISANKMRITAQLIDVKEDFHFWSETFDHSVEDIFAVQDEISLLIADKLREHLGHFEIEDHLVDTPEIPVRIYKDYLKSRYHLLKMTKTDLEKGLSILEKIIAQQPGFALAHLGMHLGYTLLGTIGLIPANAAFAKGHQFLEKAIELDENLPECQLHLSYIAFLQKWDLEKAYYHLNKSFEIRPTVEYYQSMASVLIAERKAEAALNYIETALQIDPFSAINYHLKGFIFYTQEKYETAIVFFDKAIQLNPHFMASTLYKGQALLLAGQSEKGLAYFQQLPPEGGDDIMKLGGITLAHVALGAIQKAEEGMRELQKILETDMMERALNFLVLCQASLGRANQTLELIEKGIVDRLPMVVYFYAEPMLKFLHPDARFQKLMKQVLGDENTFNAPKRKYKKALLNEAELNKYVRQLELLMQNEKLFLDPDLTLRALASQLNLPPNYLSQVLNEGLGKNFSEFVNTYRLEAFKSKVLDPGLQHLTILALAFESGFSSKTVFNTFFKKMMGKTPHAWWKEVKNK